MNETAPAGLSLIAPPIPQPENGSAELSLLAHCGGEMIRTFLLVLFGCGAGVYQSMLRRSSAWNTGVESA